MTNPSFVQAYNRGVQAAGDYHWHWRVHIGLWAAKNASFLSGDFVECGVNRGFMSSAIMEFLEWDKREKLFYLLDTFSGLDMRYVSKEDIDCGAVEKNAKALDSGFYVTTTDSVTKNFSQWSNIKIIPGSIPDTLPQVNSKEIAFLHLDINCSPPEIAALEYFWNSLVPGAMVLLDDYAYKGYESQKHAMDLFADKKGVLIASLPTGQGLLIKPKIKSVIEPKKPSKDYKFDSVPIKVNSTNHAISERLLKAFSTSMNRLATLPRIPKGAEDLWDRIYGKDLADISTVLNCDNPKLLSEFLQDFGNSYVWFGGITTSIDGYTPSKDPDDISEAYYASIRKLAEYLGILQATCPEKSNGITKTSLSAIELLTQIESHLTISIVPPLGIIHTDGVRIGDYLLHYRHINALYAADRVSRLTDHRSRVAEYGGGIGLSALYSRRFGRVDYTIFDLPITLVLAGNYLIQALGPENVCLFGEQTRPNAIKLLPFWESDFVPASTFDLTLNQDSFPEIDTEILNSYVNTIARTTTKYFLSINQEYAYPKTVHEIVGNDPRYKKVYRHPCWVREGYVEELYSL